MILISTGFAWDGATHEAIARDIGAHLDCGTEIVHGSTAPDRIFRDTINHHYYDTSWDCPEGEWVCPEKDDFVAMEKALEWNKSDCYSIGVSSHYFFDSKVFWHRVQKESQSWHSRWERDVGRQYGPGFYHCGYGVCVSWRDFEEWKAEFNAFLGKPVECLSDIECPHSCIGGKCAGLLEIIIKMLFEIITW